MTKTGNIFTDGSVAFQEYVWLDNNDQLQSKMRIAQRKFKEEAQTNQVQALSPLPPDNWTISPGDSDLRDIILKPVCWTSNPSIENGEFVLCETLAADKDDDGKLILESCWSDERALLVETFGKLAGSIKPWFSFEQHYYSPDHGVISQTLAEEHAKVCSQMLSSVDDWVFRTTKRDPITACDHLLICRHILNNIAGAEDASIETTRGPYVLGCSVNFSTAEMRGEVEDEDPWEWVLDTTQKLLEAHRELVDPQLGWYGFVAEKCLKNAQRACKWDADPQYGIGDRNNAIRIPLETALNMKGHIEDCRPCADMNPYTVCRKILEVTCLT